MKIFIFVSSWICLHASLFAAMSNPYFDWVKNGRVFEHPYNYGRAGGFAYFYIEQGEEPILVNGSLQVLERMIQSQGFSRDSLERFLKHRFRSTAFVAFASGFGSGGRIIDEKCVSVYQRYAEDPVFGKIENFKITKDTVAAVQNYFSMSHVRMIDNNWDVRFFVISKQGVVETWSVSGFCAPFTIRALIRSIDEVAQKIPVIRTL